MPLTIDRPDDEDDDDDEGLSIFNTNKDFFSRYEEVQDYPTDRLKRPNFDEVHTDAGTWILPAPYVCILRAWNAKNSKLKEYSFKRLTPAHHKICVLMSNGYEVLILTPKVMGIVDDTELLPTEDD
jgi:hypothetical protein